MKTDGKYFIFLFAIFGVFLMASTAIGQPIAVERTQIDTLEKESSLDLEKEVNSDLENLIYKIKKDSEIQNLIERLSKKDFVREYKIAFLMHSLIHSLIFKKVTI